MHGVTTSPFYLPKQPVALRRRRTGMRRDNALLSVLWVHGEVEAAVFRRQVCVGSWKSTTPVTTLPAFEEALDEALTALDGSLHASAGERGRLPHVSSCDGLARVFRGCTIGGLARAGALPFRPKD